MSKLVKRDGPKSSQRRKVKGLKGKTERWQFPRSSRFWIIMGRSALHHFFFIYFPFYCFKNWEKFKIERIIIIIIIKLSWQSVDMVQFRPGLPLVPNFDREKSKSSIILILFFEIRAVLVISDQTRQNKKKKFHTFIFTEQSR